METQQTTDKETQQTTDKETQQTTDKETQQNNFRKSIKRTRLVLKSIWLVLLKFLLVIFALYSIYLFVLSIYFFSSAGEIPVGSIYYMLCSSLVFNLVWFFLLKETKYESSCDELIFLFFIVLFIALFFVVPDSTIFAMSSTIDKLFYGSLISIFCIVIILFSITIIGIILFIHDSCCHHQRQREESLV
jgi:K+-sensing histidine kinase KdpD